jgi:hypothetical protein
MTNFGSWPRHFACGLVAGGWIACGASAQEVVSGAPPARPETTGERGAAPAPSPQVGLVACIDPETGELVDPSEHPECRQALDTRPSAVVVGEPQEEPRLQEEPVETGGFKVDLKGHFITRLYGAVNERGEIEFGHGAPGLEPDK